MAYRADLCNILRRIWRLRNDIWETATYRTAGNNMRRTFRYSISAHCNGGIPMKIYPALYCR
jgi:hypothetical protein